MTDATSICAGENPEQCNPHSLQQFLLVQLTEAAAFAVTHPWTHPPVLEHEHEQNQPTQV